MPEGNHNQVTVHVLVDVDEGIADVVRYLNTIPNVRTHTSCQGTLGEGGRKPYRPYVMVTWSTEEARRRLEREFDLEIEGTFAYAHPRGHTPPGAT